MARAIRKRDIKVKNIPPWDKQSQERRVPETQGGHGSGLCGYCCHKRGRRRGPKISWIDGEGTDSSSLSTKPGNKIGTGLMARGFKAKHSHFSAV